jgi:hypothetical protein
MNTDSQVTIVIHARLDDASGTQVTDVVLHFGS